jgi:hypothetical protein
MNDRIEYCDTCKYRRALESDEGIVLTCHRFPPQANIVVNDYDQVYITADFPEVDVSDWCGEYVLDEQIPKETTIVGASIGYDPIQQKYTIAYRYSDGSYEHISENKEIYVQDLKERKQQNTITII